MNSPANDSMYALQDVPGKGKGLVATRNIPKGTRILSEQALFTVRNVTNEEKRQRLISQQVDLLSNDQRDAFLCLHNVYSFTDPAKRYLGIFKTNCLPAGGTSSGYGSVICLEACRLNHDCENNAMYDWNHKIQRLTVHAIRHIDAGEEVTVAYLWFLTNRERRQRRLKASFAFTCLCRLCSLPIEQIQEHDRKIEQILWLQTLCELHSLRHPLEALGCLCAQTRILRELGREDCDLARVYGRATSLTIDYGDLARARIFAERNATIWTTVCGSDSLYVKECTDSVKSATLHPGHGFSTGWETAVGDAPDGLGPDDFENWLWKRDTPAGLTQLTNLPSEGCRANFSGFVDLAYKNGIDAAGSFRKRHSCFLGEIVETLAPDPLDLKIIDIHGKKVVLHLYTEEGEGTELSQYQRGHTVAVLNASQYVFKFGPRGIRHEDPEMIKVNTIADMASNLFCITLPIYAKFL